MSKEQASTFYEKLVLSDKGKESWALESDPVRRPPSELVKKSSSLIGTRGFKLLKKHGWVEGTGLGAHEQGRTEPVKAACVDGTSGIGFIARPKTSKHICEDKRVDIEKERERERAIARQVSILYKDESYDTNPLLRTQNLAT